VKAECVSSEMKVGDSVVMKAANHELELCVALILDVTGKWDMLKMKLENCVVELKWMGKEGEKVKNKRDEMKVRSNACSYDENSLLMLFEKFQSMVSLTVKQKVGKLIN
jgi:hypothetical protein